jgi:hypothetical protein
VGGEARGGTDTDSLECLERLPASPSAALRRPTYTQFSFAEIRVTHAHTRRGRRSRSDYGCSNTCVPGRSADRPISRFPCSYAYSRLSVSLAPTTSHHLVVRQSLEPASSFSATLRLVLDFSLTPPTVPRDPLTPPQLLSPPACSTLLIIIPRPHPPPPAIPCTRRVCSEQVLTTYSPTGMTSRSRRPNGRFLNGTAR